MIDFAGLSWQATPYENVSVHCFEQTPSFSGHAVRLGAWSEIGLHYHQREEEWSELLMFMKGGDIGFFRGSWENISGSSPVYRLIKPKEVYGIRNLSSEPLYFLSVMTPGFTGFGEIVQVK